MKKFRESWDMSKSISKFWEDYKHVNYLKLHGGVDPIKKISNCYIEEIYDLADCLCLEYHECVGALRRVEKLEKENKLLRDWISTHNTDYGQ